MASGLGSGAAGASTAPASPTASRAAPGAHARAGAGTGAPQPPGGFAGVLAGAGPADGATAPPPTQAKSANKTPAQPADDGPDEPALPEQILNLLAGWPDPATAAGTGTGDPAPTAVLAGDAGDGLVAAMPPGATLPGPSGLPGMTGPGSADADAGTVPAARIDGIGPAATAGALALGPLAATGDSESADVDAAGLMAGSLAPAAEDGNDTLPAASSGNAAADAVEFALPTGALAATSPSRLAAAAMAAGDPVAMPADPDAGFDDTFGARIGWLADQRIGHAQIRVSPDHAGPIDVRLQLDGTRVSAEFTSANADVRHALEASVGRLRDMLGQQGLQLGHAGVGSGQSDNPGGRASTGTTNTPGSGEGNGAVNHLPETALARRGLLDEYA